MEGSGPSDRLRVSEARLRTKRTLSHKVVLEIDAQTPTDQVEFLPVHDVGHEVGLCIEFGSGLVEELGGNIHRA